MDIDYLYNNINVKNDFVNNEDKVIIAGPCTFSSYEEVYSIAKSLKDLGIKYFRAGAYKGRTNPYSFQGLRDEGIEILLRVKKELGLNQKNGLYIKIMLVVRRLYQKNYGINVMKY